MKRIVLLSLLLLSMTLLSAHDGKAILEKADTIFTLNRIYQKNRMTIYAGAEAQPEQIMESYLLKQQGSSASLSIFLEPKRVAGTAYLTIGDDLWVRFASTGRIRKLSSSAKQNSASGSDFSYEDLGEGNEGYSEGYRAESVEETEYERTNCYRITVIPDSADSSYEKAVCYIAQDDFRYLRIELYKNGTHLKTMTLEDYRTVSDILYPFRIIMESVIKDSKTVIEVIDFEFNSSKVNERLFTRSYLERLN